RRRNSCSSWIRCSREAGPVARERTVADGTTGPAVATRTPSSTHSHRALRSRAQRRLLVPRLRLQSPAALLRPRTAVWVVGGGGVTGLVEDAGLLRGEMQADGPEILLELLQGAGSEDHRADARTVDEPG